MTQTDTLRQLLTEPGIIPMPGVFDAISVRLADVIGGKIHAIDISWILISMIASTISINEPLSLHPSTNLSGG